MKVEGPKGKLSFPFNPLVKIEVAGNEVRVTRPDESRVAKGLHGLTRTLVANAIDGVTKGYERALEISGVGFHAEVKGKDLHFALGFSHPVVFQLPEGVTADGRPEADPHHAVDGRRQGAARPDGREDPRAAPARAVQGQGHQVRGRDDPSQGGQDRRGLAADRLMRRLVMRRRKEDTSWKSD